jgi:hypothetical protein
MSDVLEPTDTLTEHQIELEKLYSKNQLMPRIKAEILASPFDFMAYFDEKGIPAAFGLDLLAQMALHKRATLPTLVGILFHHLEDAQATADMLVKAAEAELVTWDPALRIFIVVGTVSDEVQAELDRFQFPLPIVVEPQRVTHNRQSGYLLNQKSIILRNNHHEDDVCLDHINRLNQVKLTLNMNVVQKVKNTWRNLAKPKEGETPQEFMTRKRAFEKYDRTSKDVMDTLMAHSDTFYLTHRYDKRGRTYCMGYHVTYQGNDWNKACIEFAEKEIIE